MAKIYYCTTCQTRAQNVSTSVTACATAGQAVDDALWTQMKNTLVAINTFGSADTASTRLPNVSGLGSVSSGNTVSISQYQQLYVAAGLGTSYPMVSGDSLSGTYMNSLKNTINNYQIPSTRYYCDACEANCQTGCQVNCQSGCQVACQSQYCTDCKQLCQFCKAFAQ